jgi:hypothetical protein
VSSRPCFEHIGACAGPYPRGNAGRVGELASRPSAVAHVIVGQRKPTSASNSRLASGFAFRSATAEPARVRGGHPAGSGFLLHWAIRVGASRTHLVSARRRLGRPGTRRLPVSLIIHRSQAQVAAVMVGFSVFGPGMSMKAITDDLDNLAFPDGTLVYSREDVIKRRYLSP